MEGGAKEKCVGFSKWRSGVAPHDNGKVGQETQCLWRWIPLHLAASPYCEHPISTPSSLRCYECLKSVPRITYLVTKIKALTLLTSSPRLIFAFPKCPPGGRNHDTLANPKTRSKSSPHYSHEMMRYCSDQ